MPPIRCFIAIEFDQAVRSRLLEARRALVAQAGDAVRWARPEGLHVTLKFLGNVAPDRLPTIYQALRDTARQAMPFTLSFSGLSAFPSLRRPRTLWLGLGGDIPRLLTLQASVKRAIAPLGFPTEEQPFAAHITLGRVTGHLAGPIALAADVFTAASQRVDFMSLMKSELRPGGSVYTRLSAFPLAP